MGTVDSSDRNEAKSAPPDSPRMGEELRRRNSSLEQYPVTPAAHKFLKSEKLDFDQLLRRRLIDDAAKKTVEISEEGSPTKNVTVTGVQLTLAEVMTVVDEYRQWQEEGKERHQTLYAKNSDDTVPADRLDINGRVTCGCGKCKFQPASWNRVSWRTGVAVVQTIQNGPDAGQPMRNGNFVVARDSEGEAIVIAISRRCYEEYARAARDANPEADVRQLTFGHAQRIADAINYQASQRRERTETVRNLASGAISRRPRPNDLFGIRVENTPEGRVFSREDAPKPPTVGDLTVEVRNSRSAKRHGQGGR